MMVMPNDKIQMTNKGLKFLMFKFDHWGLGFYPFSVAMKRMNLVFELWHLPFRLPRERV